MKIYFGADWHLYHKNILKFTNRPFSSMDDMKDMFIHEWKSKVKDGDMVFLLGDISFHNKAVYDLEHLPGYKFLIKGNHDPDWFAKSKRVWNEVYSYHKLYINEGKQKVILCHYPIESWDSMKYGSIHLHGHTHNNVSHEISLKENRIDVGYDHTKQALSTIDELLELQKIDLTNDKINRIEHIINGDY
jgi:calcineurin-like phosphoesterase family protein